MPEKLSNRLSWGLIALFFTLSASFTNANTILVHGDSLSAGYGMPPEQTWVQLLQDSLGETVTVINSSISGETSKGGLERLPGLLEVHQPSILILELGANDGLRGYPLPQLRANLVRMIEMAQAENTQVVVLGIRLPPNYGRRYTEPFFNLFNEVAADYDLPYLPFLLDGVAQFSDLMQADGLHPTAEAQPIILENVKPLVDSLLQ
jgi:acyl-CoA thioesterase-1